MDVILARFSAAELRVNCLTAVHDELQQANVQLLPALEVLKRALCVVRASRELYKGSLVASDTSPDVSTALTQLVTVCDGIGTLMCELNREINHSGASDVSTEDEEDQQKIAEPKEEVMPVEKKKAAKESIISPKIERNKAPDSKTSNHSIAIIDLSLSDEEKEPPVKEEKKEIVPDPPTVATVPVDERPRERQELFDFGVPEVQEDSKQVEEDTLGQQEVPARKRSRKRKAPSRIAPPVAKRPVKDVVIRLQKRAEMVPSGAVGVTVCSALNAAVTVENSETTGVFNSSIGDFVSATAEAAKMLVGVHKQHPVQCERHLEDMRLLMSVAIMNLENGMSADVAKKAWVMLKTLQKLHKLYPVKTKGLHRKCQQLYKTLVKDYEVPADEVKSFKSKLAKLFIEVDEYPLDDPDTRWFDNQLSLVNELVDGRFERWNPRMSPILGKTVSKLERICTFGLNEKWNDRYAAICLTCSKMSRMAFSLRSDLTSDRTNYVIRTSLEPGFEDSDRVEKDFKHVTGYEVEVQYASDPSAKKEAFDELIDQLRYIFNAVAMTRKQSLVSLDRLKRLNECFETLIRICDYGNTLNLEQCLHLEKLLVVLRQVIYIRKDYASVSKRAVKSLISLFPENKRPRFVFPDLSQV
ncbi:hypothetical protein DVH05_027600 [Phytophthora capsici]|nr:hypothetical protein DVH05_027600 [Phytophthora capsici]